MEQFIRQLLQEKGVPSDLEPEVYDQLVKDLSDRASDLINKRLIENLTDEDATDLNTLLDTNPGPRRIQEFFAQRVPERQKIATRALAEFRTLYLGKN